MEVVRLVLRTTILVFLDVFAFVDLMEVVRLVLRTTILIFFDSAFPFLLDELLHHLLRIRIAFSKKRIIVVFYFFTSGLVVFYFFTSGLYEYKFFSIIYNFAYMSSRTV